MLDTSGQSRNSPKSHAMPYAFAVIFREFCEWRQCTANQCSTSWSDAMTPRRSLRHLALIRNSTCGTCDRLSSDHRNPLLLIDNDSCLSAHFREMPQIRWAALNAAHRMIDPSLSRACVQCHENVSSGPIYTPVLVEPWEMTSICLYVHLSSFPWLDSICPSDSCASSEDYTGVCAWWNRVHVSFRSSWDDTSIPSSSLKMYQWFQIIDGMQGNESQSRMQSENSELLRNDLQVAGCWCIETAVQNVEYSNLTTHMTKDGLPTYHTMMFQSHVLMWPISDRCKWLWVVLRWWKCDCHDADKAITTTLQSRLIESNHWHAGLIRVRERTMEEVSAADLALSKSKVQAWIGEVKTTANEEKRSQAEYAK